MLDYKRINEDEVLKVIQTALTDEAKAVLMGAGLAKILICGDYKPESLPLLEKIKDELKKMNHHAWLLKDIDWCGSQ